MKLLSKRIIAGDDDISKPGSGSMGLSDPREIEKMKAAVKHEEDAIHKMEQAGVKGDQGEKCVKCPKQFPPQYLHQGTGECHYCLRDHYKNRLKNVQTQSQEDRRRGTPLAPGEPERRS